MTRKIGRMRKNNGENVRERCEKKMGKMKEKDEKYEKDGKNKREG